MERELRKDSPVSPELLASVPEDLAQAEVLATWIEKMVHEETGGGVHDLSVEVRGDEIFLRGTCTSFYCKQLAQHAAMGIPGDVRLMNHIEVK